jgi:flagellar protein FlbD
MIVVTRLNKQEVALNSDLIEFVEALPDTTLRLVTGKILVVRESMPEVLAKIRAWRSSVLAGAGLDGALAASLAPSVLVPQQLARHEQEEEEHEFPAGALDRFLEIPA